MPRGDIIREHGTHYGDLKIVCTFPGDILREMIIDVTVGSTHAASNRRYTINEDKYSAGLADHMADIKDKKHTHYLHDGNAIGFALDSMGGISKAAMNFTNLMYAKGKGDYRRRWDSENMRVALKKQFLDRLSSVICHHRVRDFIHLGIPKTRLDLAQVQAQVPAFLAEAYAVAEVQAQIQVPLIQVSDVSDVNSYIHSANSPVVVC